MDRYCLVVIAAIFVSAVLAGDGHKESSIADDKQLEGFWKRDVTGNQGFWKRDADNAWYDDEADAEDEKRAKYFLGKRAKYFLGKREDEDFDDELAAKRAKYFLGKRAKYFLGKRAKYFLGKRADDIEASPELRELMYELGKRQRPDSFDNVIRRAKYFLGKRADDFEQEDFEKRAKYFLGKRSGAGEMAEDKRQQKYFLGKRSAEKSE